MPGDPADPASFTDFDVDNPVSFEWKGREVQVYRLAAFDSQTGTQAPRLVVLVDGQLRPPIGPAQSTDTRESIRAKAEAYLSSI